MSEKEDVSRRGFLRTAAGATAAAGAATTASKTAGAQSEEPDWGGWVEQGNISSTEDARGQEEVTVMCGAGDDGLAFDPTGIWVDVGTTITWEWTGDGGAHNVAAVDGPADFLSDIVDEEGYTFEYEFTEDDEGITEYLCEPHEAVNMFGSVAVGDDIPTVGGEDAGVGGAAAPMIPDAARTLGVATFIAMMSTVAFAFFFLKYGGDYEDES